MTGGFPRFKRHAPFQAVGNVYNERTNTMKIHFLSDGEIGEPEDNQRHLPGTRLRIASTRTYGITSHNDVGGTADVPRGQYAVIVTRSWFDYETGNRYIGQLIEQVDVDRVTAATRTAYGPKTAGWDPSIVYFGDEEVV